MMSICNSCGMSGMSPDGCGAPRCPFGVHRAEHPQTTIARLTRENEALRAERDAWKANAEALDHLLEGAVSYYPMASSADVRWVELKKKVRANHAKLKGDV